MGRISKKFDIFVGRVFYPAKIVRHFFYLGEIIFYLNRINQRVLFRLAIL